MPFAVEDFQDLIRLLGEHPEWRTELRRHVLSDELLELPDLVRQIAEQLAALTARVDQLAERMEQLAEAQARTEEQLKVLTQRVEWLATDVGSLKGEVLELRYRARAVAYFSRLARRLRLVNLSDLADRLDDAVEEQRLTDIERNAVLLADLILSGQRRADRAPIYLLVEVSVGIARHDVERAADRAAILARLGQPVVPVVAGNGITQEAAALADFRGVQQVLDGRLEP